MGTSSRKSILRRSCYENVSELKNVLVHTPDRSPVKFHTVVYLVEHTSVPDVVRKLVLIEL